MGAGCVCASREDAEEKAKQKENDIYKNSMKKK